MENVDNLFLLKWHPYWINYGLKCCIKEENFRTILSVNYFHWASFTLK